MVHKIQKTYKSKAYHTTHSARTALNYPPPILHSAHERLTASTYTPQAPTLLRTHNHRVFTVCRPDLVTSDPDTSATDILLRQQHSSILTDVIPYTDSSPAPAFHVASQPNYNNIITHSRRPSSYRSPTRPPPSPATSSPTTSDLDDNLFGLAPLLNNGCTATFINKTCAITITVPPQFRVSLYLVVLVNPVNTKPTKLYTTKPTLKSSSTPPQY
jgi:hypothetical protein